MNRADPAQIAAAALCAALLSLATAASAGAVAIPGAAHSMVGLTGRGIALTGFAASTQAVGKQIAVRVTFAGRATASPRSFDLDAYICSRAPSLPRTCRPSATRRVRFTSTATSWALTLTVPRPSAAVDAILVRLDVPRPSSFSAAEIVLPARAWTQYAGRAFGVTATQSATVKVAAMRADAAGDSAVDQTPSRMSLLLGWTVAGPPSALATTSWLACPTCAPDVRNQTLTAAGTGTYSPFQRDLKRGADPLWTTSLTVGSTTAYSVTLPWIGRS